MKRGTIQVLSFISGLTLAAVVIGVTLSKSPSLRNEVESQAKSVLKTTRTLVDSYKSVVSKSKMAVNLVKNDPKDTALNKDSEAERQSADLENQWDAVEAQSAS